MLQNVYLKSNEISFEVKRLQNIPALEIREKNGKAKSKGKSQKLQDMIDQVGLGHGTGEQVKKKYFKWTDANFKEYRISFVALLLLICPPLPKVSCVLCFFS